MDGARVTDRGAGSDGRRNSWLAYRWWRRVVVGPIDHRAIIRRVAADSRWSPLYLFMVMMSAGIAVLGLLQSSPAVVIGAMLISPLMSPILGLGFSMALFDLPALKRSLSALAAGALVAVLFTATIVLLSPIQGATSEILARTRPSLFDLLVALFAASAGTMALVRGRGATIVGVAIATALMPPLAVVGFGLATGNMAVLGGALALFATNFLTIALTTTLVARLLGFGHHLSDRQSWAQTILLLLTFALMSVPLGLSLGQIARETLAAAAARSSLQRQFGKDARVAQLDIDHGSEPLEVRAVIIAPRGSARDERAVERRLAIDLGRAVRLDMDTILLDPAAGPIEAQRAELGQAQAGERDRQAGGEVARIVALAAGVEPGQVTIDREGRRAVTAAVPLPGATAATYLALEQRAAASAPGWTVEIVPPLMAMAPIIFPPGSAELKEAGSRAVALAAWQARRWNVAAVTVSGFEEGGEDDENGLAARRARAVAELLRGAGIAVTGSAPVSGDAVVLAPVAAPTP